VSTLRPRLVEEAGRSSCRGGWEFRASVSRSTRRPVLDPVFRALTGLSITVRLVPSRPVTVLLRLRVRSTS
jgi:hypothetical protein